MGKLTEQSVFKRRSLNGKKKKKKKKSTRKCLTSLAIREIQVKTTLRFHLAWGIKENDGGVNSTMIYCKNFCRCHSVPQYNNNMTKKDSTSLLLEHKHQMLVRL
jgi:hypothetical protein